MYRLYYTPIQPTLPCSFELTSEHEGSLPFNEIHAVVCLRNQPYSVFNEITLDTMNDERKFVVCAVHCRRDADGCLKATISLPKFPPGQQVRGVTFVVCILLPAYSCMCM
ncbi:hypothetical protein EON63_00065 [archaeon]|nr:MAG: hypothetical protein EON63_00065 [archaeon]